MKAIQHILLAAAIIMGIWSFLWFFPFINRVRLIASQDQYQTGVFTTTGVRYDPQTTDQPADWWAVGTIKTADGGTATDELLLLNITIDDPGSTRALAEAVPVGTEYQVLFNPNALKSFVVQGEYLRVFMDEGRDFWDEQRSWRNKILRNAFLPFGVCVIAYVVVRKTNKARTTSTAQSTTPSASSDA